MLYTNICKGGKIPGFQRTNLGSIAPIFSPSYNTVYACFQHMPFYDLSCLICKMRQLELLLVLKSYCEDDKALYQWKDIIISCYSIPLLSLATQPVSHPNSIPSHIISSLVGFSLALSHWTSFSLYYFPILPRFDFLFFLVLKLLASPSLGTSEQIAIQVSLTIMCYQYSLALYPLIPHPSPTELIWQDLQ